MRNSSVKSTVYDADFHARISERSHKAAMTVLPLLVEAGIPFASVTDVGGGTGNWSRAAQEIGAKTVTLIDGAYVDTTTLKIPAACYIPRDLSQKFSVPERADLAICVEVAEHLRPTRAASFVEDLCAISDNVLFSAALPFQGGDGHVNEIWPEYWASLFAAQGYDAYDFIRPAIWTDPQVDWWYRQNLLLFSARPKNALVPHEIGGTPPCQPDEPLTRIHPEGYVWLAYKSRPESFRTPAQRVIKLQTDPASFSPPPKIGYGGEFDSIPRPELLKLDNARLRAVIVGPGCSGSSLLADTLSEHPELFCLNENPNLSLLKTRFGTGTVPARALIDSFLATRTSPGEPPAEINACSAGKSPAHLHTFLDRVENIEPELNLARFSSYIAAYYKTAAQASILVEKTLNYAHHLNDLLALWPDLRIVLMVRNAAESALLMRGREDYQSLVARGETSRAGLLAAPDDPSHPTSDAPDTLSPYLDIWSARVTDALDIGEKLDPTQFTVLRYEDLCAAPRDEGRRLLRFLGTDPTPAWLDRIGEAFDIRAEPSCEHGPEAETAAAAHACILALNARLKYR